MLSMRPKQRPGEKEASFVRVRFWEIHCKVFFPEKLTILAVPKQVDKGFGRVITKRKSLPVLHQFCGESNWSLFICGET